MSRPFRPLQVPAHLACSPFTPFLYRRSQSLPCFYGRAFKLVCRSFLEIQMDIVFIVGIGLLWGVMALLVVGFRKLERPPGGRP